MSATSAPRRIRCGVGTPQTLRAHWALAELGLDYERRPIQSRSGETQTAAFTALNARQKIPVLQDGALTLTESAAIISYLSDRYATDANRLLPLELEARAHCLELCFFAVSELDATSLYVLRRHEGLPEIYGEAPAANVAVRDYFGKQMHTVDRLLEDGRPFVLGDQFSAADIVLGSCLGWARAVGLLLSERAVAYHEGLMARRGYALAAARNAVP